MSVKRPGRAASSAFGSDPGVFFAFVFPGLVIFALLFLGQALAMRLLRDRMRGLQRRLAVTPASRAAVLAGGAVYLVTALVAALVVLAVLGVAIFRIQLRNPPALLLIALGFAVFAAGPAVADPAAWPGAIARPRSSGPWSCS